MGYSSIASAEFQSLDVSVPGAPNILSAKQVSNTALELIVGLPTTDFDGSALTGLTSLVWVTTPQVNGADPFGGLSMDEVLQLPGIQKGVTTLTPDAAGTSVTLTLPVVNLGGFQSIAVAVSD